MSAAERILFDRVLEMCRTLNRLSWESRNDSSGQLAIGTTMKYHDDLNKVRQAAQLFLFGETSESIEKTNSAALRSLPDDGPSLGEFLQWAMTLDEGFTNAEVMSLGYGESRPSSLKRIMAMQNHLGDKRAIVVNPMGTHLDKDFLPKCASYLDTRTFRNEPIVVTETQPLSEAEREQQIEDWFKDE